MAKIIGLPRLTTQPGLRREFIPTFAKALGDFGCQVWIENDYGSDLGFIQKDYQNKNILFKDREEIFTEANLVIMRASPNMADVKKMKKGQVLISKLHFSTHPERNQELKNLGITVISLDETKDFEGKRIVQDFKSVAWSAVTAGFEELRKVLGEDYWFKKDREPIAAYLLGFGEVGKQALEGCLKMGNTNFLEELINKGGNPLVEVLPMVSVHSKYDFLKNKIISKSLKLGGRPHLLIDASQRKDPSQTVVKEEILSLLPKETVIVDISADRYDGIKVVKAIQGIPTGDEAKFVFYPDDNEWQNQKIVPIDYQLKRENQRVVVSNYAWASYGDVNYRKKNIEKYGMQILPLLKRFIEMDWQNLSDYEKSSEWSVEKAIVQSTLDSYLRNSQKI